MHKIIFPVFQVDEELQVLPGRTILSIEQPDNLNSRKQDKTPNESTFCYARTKLPALYILQFLGIFVQIKSTTLPRNVSLAVTSS